MTRSLNKVTLIGNLTRDPELKYTPSGAAVCTFGLATNRQWEKDGQKQEDVEFHRIVAWNKLAELCSQLLSKGRKVYLEGRLQTRKWTGQDEVERTTTEIVINEMIILDPKGSGDSSDDSSGQSSQSQDEIPETQVDNFDPDQVDAGVDEPKRTKSKSSKQSTSDDDDDIPF